MNGFDWVTIKKASESTGLGESALRHYIEDGVWLEGVEYVRRNGRILISISGYNRWVERGQASPSMGAASASA